MKKTFRVLVLTVFLGAARGESEDSLRIRPLHPTVHDSITFTFIDPYACCVTAYYNKTVNVADSAIYISYSFDNSDCTLAYCAFPTNWTSVTASHLPAVEYAIYAAATPHCVGEDCLDYDLEPRYLGRIAVTDPPIVNNALIVIPSEPTTNDSITIKVLDPYGCCLTEYFHLHLVPTSLSDNGILLSTL